MTYLQSIILDAIQGLTEFSSDGDGQVPLLVPLAGPIAAAITGWFAIDLLMRAVRIGSLRGFALYCWIVGLLALAWGGINGIGG